MKVSGILSLTQHTAQSDTHRTTSVTLAAHVCRECVSVASVTSDGMELESPEVTSGV